ncbi:hypothetical protein HC891_09855 [Candidatus Gracilibacteria bacterium]|nr:hypothetical protein [Candidatus Gracilibacteria bacterium]
MAGQALAEPSTAIKNFALNRLGGRIFVASLEKQAHRLFEQTPVGQPACSPTLQTMQFALAKAQAQTALQEIAKKMVKTEPASFVVERQQQIRLHQQIELELCVRAINHIEQLRIQVETEALGHGQHEHRLLQGGTLLRQHFSGQILGDLTRGTIEGRSANRRIEVSEGGQLKSNRPALSLLVQRHNLIGRRRFRLHLRQQIARLCHIKTQVAGAHLYQQMLCAQPCERQGWVEAAKKHKAAARRQIAQNIGYRLVDGFGGDKMVIIKHERQAVRHGAHIHQKRLDHHMERRSLAGSQERHSVR